MVVPSAIDVEARQRRVGLETWWCWTVVPDARQARLVQPGHHLNNGEVEEGYGLDGSLAGT
jgi:hypothetical protein